MKCVLVLAVLLVAGCGGDSPTYAAEPTTACLREAGLKVDSVGRGLLPGPASGGTFVSDLGGVEAYLAFGRDEEEAEQKAHDYRLLGIEDDGLLVQEANVVMAWCCSMPTDEQRAAVEDCLSE